MKNIMKRINHWWNSGGGIYLFSDSAGDPVFSMTNGESLRMIVAMSVGTVSLIVLAVRFFAK